MTAIGVGVGLPFTYQAATGGLPPVGPPATALIDEIGAYLTDQTGAYILGA